MRVAIACLLLVVATTAQTTEPPPGPSLSSAWLSRLRGAYAESKPAVEAWARELGAMDAATRARVTQRLIAVFAQAIADDSPAPAPWKKYPSSWESNWTLYTHATPALELRQALAKVIATGRFGDAALPVIAWVSIHDRDDVSRPLLDRLIVMTGPAADKTLLDILEQAPDTAAAKLLALRAATERGLALPATTLRRSAFHFRKEIRVLARRHARSLGLPENEPYDPLVAVRSPMIRSLLADLARYIPFLPPEDAPFVVVKATPSPDANEPVDEGAKSAKPHTHRGWLIEDNEDAWTLFTPFGQYFRWQKRPGAYEVTVRRRAVSTEIEWIRHQRARIGKSETALDGWCCESACTIYELVFASWLARHERYPAVAEILMPALVGDEYWRERDYALGRALQDHLGHRLGEWMVTTWVTERDRREAMRLARVLLDTFPACTYRPIARTLLAELPARADDDGALALPTPEAWRAQRASLNRRSAIHFLMKRLRLITDIACMYRIGYNESHGLRSRQTRFVRGLDDVLRSPQIRYVGPTVINPIIQLVGEPEYESDEKGYIQGMRLTVADVPSIAPYLASDFHTRCIAMDNMELIWRLVPVVVAVCDVLERAAGFPLVDADALEGLPPEERRRVARQLIDWARRYGSASKSVRLIGLLRTAREAGRAWDYALQKAAATLIESEANGVDAALLAWVERTDIPPGDLIVILELLAKVSPRLAAERAARLLDHRKHWVRARARDLMRTRR